jgi:hypothetical protein
MREQIGVKFTYYRMGTTISIMTGFEEIDEVMNQGLENVALECVKEIGKTIGMDLNKLSHPYPPARFCFFSELSMNIEDESLIQGKQIKAYKHQEHEQVIG